MSWLSERLRELLDKRKLSIQTVASAVGVERAYLSLIINAGREPSEDLVRRLANYFGEGAEEWAFHVKARPKIDEFRRKYPSVAPNYMRKAAKKEPPTS